MSILYLHKHYTFSGVKDIIKAKKCNYLEWILLVSFLIVAGLQIERGFLQDMGWIAGDDSTYVSWASDALQTDVIGIIDPHTGLAMPLYFKRIGQTYLVFSAYLSSISQFSLPAVVHTIQYVHSLCLSYFIYYYMAGELFNKRDERLLFMLIISVFYIFGYHSFYSLTIRMLGPNYHGKAILAIAATPLVLTLLMKSLKHCYQRYEGILLFIISIAIISLTPWAIGTMAVIILVPIVISMFRKEREWKHLLYVLWGMAPVVSSLGIYLLYKFAV